MVTLTFTSEPWLRIVQGILFLNTSVKFHQNQITAEPAKAMITKCNKQRTHAWVRQKTKSYVFHRIPSVTDVPDNSPHNLDIYLTLKKSSSASYDLDLKFNSLRVHALILTRNWWLDLRHNHIVPKVLTYTRMNGQTVTLLYPRATLLQGGNKVWTVTGPINMKIKKYFTLTTLTSSPAKFNIGAAFLSNSFTADLFKQTRREDIIHRL